MGRPKQASVGGKASVSQAWVDSIAALEAKPLRFKDIAHHVSHLLVRDQSNTAAARRQCSGSGHQSPKKPRRSASDPGTAIVRVHAMQAAHGCRPGTDPGSRRPRSSQSGTIGGFLQFSPDSMRDGEQVASHCDSRCTSASSSAAVSRPHSQAGARKGASQAALSHQSGTRERHAREDSLASKRAPQPPGSREALRRASLAEDHGTSAGEACCVDAPQESAGSEAGIGGAKAVACEPARGGSAADARRPSVAAEGRRPSVAANVPGDFARGAEARGEPARSTSAPCEARRGSVVAEAPDGAGPLLPLRLKSKDLRSLRFGGKMSEQDLGDHQADCRELLRAELAEHAGGAREAFRRLDLNGSGQVSMSEFGQGLERFGIDCYKLLGIRKVQDVFKLFDANKVGAITYAELFPEEAANTSRREFDSTPRFWAWWCQQADDVAETLQRPPLWKPQSQEAELDELRCKIVQEQAVEKRGRWMSATFDRLKGENKSDARAREVVARHLPRGTGPSDRQGVPMFSESEVRSCKKAYNDWVVDHSRNIQKTVSDMRDQRRILSAYRHKLWSVTMQKELRERAEAEMKMAAASIAGDKSLLMGLREDDEIIRMDKVPTDVLRSMFGRVARDCKVDKKEVEDLHVAYSQHADPTGMLKRRGFANLLCLLCPVRTLSDSDLTCWWKQAMEIAASEQLPEGTNKNDVKLPSKTQCNFEQFIRWFVDSELRSMHT